MQLEHPSPHACRPPPLAAPVIRVDPSRFELLTPTLSVWCSNQAELRISVAKKLKEGSNSCNVIHYSSKKEVFQPHLPIRLPCYDLAPVTSFTLGGSLRLPTLGTPGFHGLTGGVYKVRERIHRIIADIRLLAIPASCSRVADCNLN